MARILAVDDSEQNLVMIELYLHGQGFEVVTVTRGKEALELVAKQSFDLVILDVMMPEMDGMEVCHRLKADPQTARVPVIFVTGRLSDESERVQAYELGAIDYIQKPIQKAELVARIRAMLRLEEARKQLELENQALRGETADLRRGLRDAEQRVNDLQQLGSAIAEQRRTGLVLLGPDWRVLAADAGARGCLGELQDGRELLAAGLVAARLQRLLVEGATHGELNATAGEQVRNLGFHVSRFPDGNVAVQLRDNSAELTARERLLLREPFAIRAGQSQAGYTMGGFIGESPAILELAEMVDQLRNGRSTVLIHGESGTGKELVARALHYDGRNRHRPFIPIHCGAIAPELIESELFGYEKGAFTGAQTSREGLFSVADGGTIFLDEIAETSADLQVKLLRVLQLGEIRPVGANRTRLVDVRIIAATNRDLLAMVREGSFREDLYFRLEVVKLHLPSLRERPADIPLLVSHFLRRFNQRYGRDERPVRAVSSGAMECLLDYPWPGNVRELENVIDRAFALGAVGVLQVDDLPLHVREGRPLLVEAPAVTPGAAAPPAAAAGTPPLDLRSRKRNAERDAILAALDACGGDKRAASRMLNIPRSTFYRRLRELDIDRGATS